MNSVEKTELITKYKHALKKLAGRLASEPDRWVLFLGSGVSAGSAEDRRRVFSSLAGKVCENADVVPATQKLPQFVKNIHKAVQNSDFAELSDTLFGDTWDNASFLDADREWNIKLRRAYAEQLLSKDEIDVYKTDKNLPLQELIETFRGIILTTCQDDTVEAFWEYGNSLPADSIVYTPQIIADSNDWNRWLRATPKEIAYLKFQSEPMEPTTILVKLFGSRDAPTRMLLSKQDIEEFYPVEEKQASDEHTYDDTINTIRFLEKIFSSRNILFVGVDFDNDWLLKASKGILTLLTREPPADVKRYALLCERFDAEEYHIQTINNSQEIMDIAQNPQETSKDPRAMEISETDPLQSQEEILGLFWLFYNRRPQRLFLPVEKHDIQDSIYSTYAMEYAVLKKDVFRFQDTGTNSQEWNRKNIRQLAIAANNFSDFYDLRDAMNLARSEEDEPYETTIQRLLSGRLSEKGLLLYQMLQRYESGFPTAFLQLLPKNKYGLKSWRRAGIQLANSGIYVRRHGKERLYERLSYADCVMRTAGRSLFQSRIRNEIDSISCQSMYSYFYPFHKVELKEGKEIESEIEKHFTEMLLKLYSILRDKGEEYQQIHSLLQTELPAIVNIMRAIPDNNLKCKPGLLYYLLRESRVSVKREGLIEFCDSLQQQCGEPGAPNGEEPQWQLFSEKLMLHQAKALLMSQSSEELEIAAAECEEVEHAVCKAQEEQILWKGEVPGQIFEHRVYAWFLHGTILGRMSTIYEIERCRDRVSESTMQRSLLEKMRKSLDCAGKLIEERECALGEKYEELKTELARLMGEYYFKMSQYYAESRRFAEADTWSEEKDCYEKSEKEYTHALEYYNRSPVQRWVQRADAMRNIGDMYCQWSRSMSEALPESQMASEACNQPKSKRYELTKKCYENLVNAYILYRSHFDIHGVADVLQSMGQVEGYNSFKEDKQRCRSHLCYYKASVDLYQHLGDAWSSLVASSFLKGCLALEGGGKEAEKAD